MTLFNTKNLPSGYTVASEIQNAFDPGEIISIVHSNDELVFIRKAPFEPSGFRKEDEPGYSVSQFIIPKASLSWVIDIIENKFWKKPKDGGAPNNVLHYETLVANEEIEIRFTPNCRKEYESGVTIHNYSRSDGWDDFTSFQIPYTTLRDKGLLTQLKSI